MVNYTWTVFAAAVLCASHVLAYDDSKTYKVNSGNGVTIYAFSETNVDDFYVEYEVTDLTTPITFYVAYGDDNCLPSFFWNPPKNPLLKENHSSDFSGSYYVDGKVKTTSFCITFQCNAPQNTQCELTAAWTFGQGSPGIGGGGVAAIIISILVVVGAGLGGFMYYKRRQRLQSQAVHQPLTGSPAGESPYHAGGQQYQQPAV